MRVIFTGLVLFLQVFASNAGYALELGGLTVTSRLNEPLSATIEVKGAATDSAAGTLVVSLASAQAHAAAGIPLDPALTSLIFTLDFLSRPAMVEIESRTPVRVPFLRFLVAVEFDEQQTFREYTAMLDPAEEWATTNVSAPVTGTSSFADAELSYPGEYVGPIRQGQTLTEIARRVKVREGISLEQTMVALVEDNPDSFIDGNMNLLREGARLHIPSERQMSQIDSQRAQAVYESHLLEWAQRQPKIRSSSTNGNWITLHSPAAAALAPDTDLAGMESAEYVLRIVKPSVLPESEDTGGKVRETLVTDGVPSAAEREETSPEAAAAVTALTDRLSAVEESLGSKELENQQLTRQVDLLQRQLEKTMKLIELQETQLAVAQKQLESMLAQEAPGEGQGGLGVRAAEEQTASIDRDTANAPDTDPESARGEESAVEETPKQDSQSASQDSGNEEDSNPVLGASEDAVSQFPRTAGDVPPPWSDPARTLEWVVSGTGMLFTVARDVSRELLVDLDRRESAIPGVSNKLLGLIAVLMLLMLLLIKRRRGSVGESGPSDSQPANGGKRNLFEAEATSKPAEEEPRETPVPEESVGAGFVTDIETQRGVAVQSDEVDPLTESEIYLAYGRSTQAEQTLRDAIARTPERIELKLKLLEVLQVLGQNEAFQKLAGEVRQIVTEGSPEQAHLEKLVRDASQTDHTDSVGEVPPGAQGESPAGANELPPAVTPGPEPTAAEPAREDGIEFELDLDPEKRATPIAQPSQSTAEPSEGSTPDGFSNFELELDVPASAMSADVSQEEDTFPTTLEDTGTPDPDAALSESGTSGATAADSEESTQLELANAYLEMGDPASAREILTALAHSGDSDIQERAKKLLETLSGSA